MPGCRECTAAPFNSEGGFIYQECYALRVELLIHYMTALHQSSSNRSNRSNRTLHSFPVDGLGWKGLPGSFGGMREVSGQVHPLVMCFTTHCTSTLIS